MVYSLRPTSLFRSASDLWSASAYARSEPTTATCFLSPRCDIMSFAGRMVMADISAGTRMVVIQNALVRTRSRYSRRMMVKTLCMLHRHARAVALGVFTDHVDEDLFERGLDQLELRDLRA